jgi:hypothetical protein
LLPLALRRYRYTTQVVLELLLGAEFMLRNFDFNDDYLGQFDWTPEDIEALVVDSELKEQVIMLAVKVLIQKGFIFGKDFSMTCEGTILANCDAGKTVFADMAVPEQVLLGQVLKVF